MVNPVPHRAHFLGEKLHFDQNKQLAMYGITHILAVDGYSQKIVVGFITATKESHHHLPHFVPASFTATWLVGSGAYGTRHWICASNHCTAVPFIYEGPSSCIAKCITAKSSSSEVVVRSQPQAQLSSKKYTGLIGRRSNWHDWWHDQILCHG